MTVLVAAQAATCHPVQVMVSRFLAKKVVEGGAVDSHTAHRAEELGASEERDVVVGMVNHC